MNLSGTTCTSCGDSIETGTRAVIISETARYHRHCWSLIVDPPKPTALERRAGRNWPRVGRCRVSA